MSELETIDANDVGTVEEVIKPTKTPAVVRNVAMQDGSVVNFGARANLLTATDGNTLTFNFSDGKQIKWDVPFVEGLTEFQQTVYLYGIAAKIKSSLAPVKFDDLEAAINKQIAAINEGNFSLRVAGEASTSLDNWAIAYAIVKAKEADFSHWVVNGEFNSTPEVVTEVATRWAGFSISEKNGLRKHAYIKLEKAKLDAVDAREAEEEVSGLI